MIEIEEILKKKSMCYSHTCLILLLIRIGRYLIIIDWQLLKRPFDVVRLTSDLVSIVRWGLQFGVVF